MPVVITFGPTDTGQTLYATIERLSDSYIWSNTTSVFESLTSFEDATISLPELAGTLAGSYRASVSSLGSPGECCVRVHDSGGVILSLSHIRIEGGSEVLNSTTQETADAVRTELTTELGRLDVTVSSRSVAGDAMTLTSAERNAIAVETESHLLDDGDSQMLINAIVEAIGNTNVDQTVLVAAIRADLERTNGNLNTLITRLTADRAAKLDRDIAHAADAATYKATGFATPADVPTVGEIGAEVSGTLTASHGAGSWTTATGYAVPGDITDALAGVPKIGQTTRHRNVGTGATADVILEAVPS